MLDFIQKLFGDKNKRLLDRQYQGVVEQIHAEKHKVRNLSDDGLRAKTAEFRAMLREAVAEIEARKVEISKELHRVAKEDLGEQELTLDERRELIEELDDLEEDWQDAIADKLDDLLPEAFAVIKEVCRRLTAHRRLRVPATDLDRALNAKTGYPKLEGNSSIWENTWQAGVPTLYGKWCPTMCSCLAALYCIEVTSRK